LIGDQ